ncbi:MAG: hypothetical protein ABS45_10960 [Comamonas sp. SCN 65-56]|uniref:DUF3619 family protein n=1 Tax=Comamonas sp. SCN 65-56 TaxID=1660095 RepID=UPI00086F8159|nr:DUF3619 family protein [Comamonas sp. SCN 65-56]ODS91601.1 MAG: hypothetical protein ABS45_10960 [Comamonas sp. SCN 65-56]
MNDTAVTLTPRADAFARRIAARLTQAGDHLHHDIAERLRAARVRAVGQRKRPAIPQKLYLHPVVAVTTQGATATLGAGEGESGGRHWGRALVSGAWIAALLIGLAWVHHTQMESVASEISEIDTALLTDDLPPAAYTDPGFAQFIKSSRTDH